MLYKNRQYLLTVIILSVLFWAGVSFLIQTFSNLYQQQVVEETKSESQKSVALVRANFEAFVFQTVYTADSLATIIMLNPKLALENWDTIAKALIDKSKYIRSVGVAPNNIISHVYPLKGNEKALGFDLRNRPDQFITAMRAKELQEVYLDGPLELVQGGQALIARFPIFLDAPLSNEYWGTVSVVLDYELIMEDSGIYRLDGLATAIRRYYQHLKDPVVFFGNAQLFTSPDLVLPILLPNSKFEIAGQYDFDDSASIEWSRGIIFVVGVSVALVLFVSALLLLRALSLARDASLQDELTKLPNRRFFMNYLGQRLTGDKKSEFTLLNIDLNDFKAVNDTYGHDVGDHFLIHVSQLLRSSVRSSDFVARMGGDEFMIVLDRIAEPNKVDSLIEKLKLRCQSKPMCYQSQLIRPSLSIGSATRSTDSKISIEELLAESDKKMYCDKLLSKKADTDISI